MTRLHDFIFRYWVLTVPILMAVAYGIYARVFASIVFGRVAAPEILFGLSSDSRLQLFVVVPTWLIAASLVLARSRSPQELLRYGTWRAAIFWPLWRCLRAFACLAVIVIALWLVVLTGTYSPGDFPDAIVTALIAMFAETALVATVLSCFYFVVAAIFLLTDSLIALTMTPIVIWTWAAMSNLAIFPADSAVNAAIYLSVGLIAANPWALIVLLSSGLTAVAICWLVANSKDESLTRAAAVR